MNGLPHSACNDMTHWIKRKTSAQLATRASANPIEYEIIAYIDDTANLLSIKRMN
jgi:hypothetical protein